MCFFFSQASAIKRFLPLFDRVLVERFAPELKTKGGIMLPEKSQGKVLQATVVATGNGNRDQVKKKIPHISKKFFQMYSVLGPDQKYLNLKLTSLLVNSCKTQASAWCLWPLRREGSLLCHSTVSQDLSFLLSHPKDHPLHI